MSEDPDLRKIVGDVAAAYFSNSHVTPSEISNVISQIASSLAAVGAATVEVAPEAAEETRLSPAQIRKSITREALISFEDNKPYKTLRRHLAVKGLTPDQYRSKWGLPNDYPMVAPAYSEARSNMAKALGLGSRLNAGATPAPAAEPAPVEAPKAARKPPGRPRKVRATP
jgi:predicted transcriptional regulator